MNLHYNPILLGFFHVMCSHQSQSLMQCHCGFEHYVITGMPFGAPSIYQSVNNVLSSVLRQYIVTNLLYIDDRLILQTDPCYHPG